MIDFAALIDKAQLFFAVFARCAALLRTAPLTSSSAGPPSARGALAFFAGIIFSFLISEQYGPLPESGLGYAMVLIAEVMLGIIMGLFLQIIFAVFQTAGQLFSFQMGFGASQVYDPLAQVEIPLIGQFLNLIGLGVFLSVSGMRKMVFGALASSFRVMKGTDFLAAPEFLNTAFIRAVGNLFEQSLILSFPILGTLILISVTMGLLAKAAPQMNLLMVGFPIQIAMGFTIMIMAAPFIIEKMGRLVDGGFEFIGRYLAAVQGALG